MNPFFIDHIGIAVSDLEKSIQQYKNDFGFALKSREMIPTQKVEVAFLSAPNTMIELLIPTEKESTLQKFLDKRGPGLHHICYRVDSIDSTLEHFKRLGYRLVDSVPRVGAHNTRIAFLHPLSANGVLIELCQYG